MKTVMTKWITQVVGVMLVVSTLAAIELGVAEMVAAQTIRLIP